MLTNEQKRANLFEQITKDLGRARPTYANVEALLKSKGWKHNNAVRGAVDYVSSTQSAGAKQ